MRISLEKANSDFNDELQRQIDGSLPKGHIYSLGYPGEILREAGVLDLPIELKAEILAYKSSENYRHPFDLSKIKDLPNAINDPLAVFAYGDKTKAVNIITRIEINEKNILVGISLNPEVNGSRLNINSVRTIFPKDKLEWSNWLKQGKGLITNPRHPEDVAITPISKYNKFSNKKQDFC